jgi:hypothetical protein
MAAIIAARQISRRLFIAAEEALQVPFMSAVRGRAVQAANRTAPAALHVKRLHSLANRRQGGHTMSNLHPGRVLPQDVVPPDGGGDAITALPVSQAEIEDLLYGDDRPAAERVERLAELADTLRNQEPGDFGDNDPARLVSEIDAAIARINGALERDPDLEFDETTMDDDPLNHRETLSPDSDELEAIEDDDEASLSDGSEPLEDEALDPEEWSEDGFDVNRGVR